MDSVYQNNLAEKEADDVGRRFMNSSDVLKDMGSAYGRDLKSEITIHDDSSADSKVKSLGKDAFASGNDIYFSQGSLNGSKESNQLLGHEAAHVIQQTGSELGQTASYGAVQGGLFWYSKSNEVALGGTNEGQPIYTKFGKKYIKNGSNYELYSGNTMPADIYNFGLGDEDAIEQARGQGQEPTELPEIGGKQPAEQKQEEEEQDEPYEYTPYQGNTVLGQSGWGLLNTVGGIFRGIAGLGAWGLGKLLGNKKMTSFGRRNSKAAGSMIGHGMLDTVMGIGNLATGGMVGQSLGAYQKNNPFASFYAGGQETAPQVAQVAQQNVPAISSNQQQEASDSVGLIPTEVKPYYNALPKVRHITVKDKMTALSIKNMTAKTHSSDAKFFGPKEKSYMSLKKKAEYYKIKAAHNRELIANQGAFGPLSAIEEADESEVD